MAEVSLLCPSTSSLYTCSPFTLTLPLSLSFYILLHCVFPDCTELSCYVHTICPTLVYLSCHRILIPSLQVHKSSQDVAFHHLHNSTSYSLTRYCKPSTYLNFHYTVKHPFCWHHGHLSDNFLDPWPLTCFTSGSLPRLVLKLLCYSIVTFLLPCSVSFLPSHTQIILPLSCPVKFSLISPSMPSHMQRLEPRHVNSLHNCPFNLLINCLWHSVPTLYRFADSVTPTSLGFLFKNFQGMKIELVIL